MAINLRGFLRPRWSTIDIMRVAGHSGGGVHKNVRLSTKAARCDAAYVEK